MGIIIKEIKISDDSYSFISDEKSEKNILKNLSKINIFIGENNSGKSRLLRTMLFKNDDIKSPYFIPNNEDFTIIKESIFHLKEEISKITGKYGIKWENISIGSSNLEEKFSKIDNLDFIKPSDTENSYENKILEFKEFLDSLTKKGGRTRGSIRPGNTVEVSTKAIGIQFKKLYDETFKDIDDERIALTLNYNFSKIYIPILRGLRYIVSKNEDVYFERTLKDYFRYPDGNVVTERSLKDIFEIEVFTGLKAYKTIRRHLLGDLNQRKLIREFENYLSKQFFDNEPIALIPKEDSNDQILTIKIGKEHEMPIHQLGDGIQSLIIITLPLFLSNDEIKENENILVFIEEPEYMLHPSLQRKLIETFYDKRFEKYQFFFTTHSNHFLDVTLDFEDISIFTLNKKLDGNNEEELPKFNIENVSFGDNNLLNLLGVRNSSVFLPNCNIWVEGISDVLYFRLYLDIYQDYMKSRDNSFKKFHEDYHYSFYKYDGSDINNLLDLNLPYDDEKLEKMFLIRDRDDSKDINKKNKDKQLEKLLENNFYLLRCREVENLLNKSTLLKTIENDKQYRKISLNKNFEYEDYKNKKLNTYIKDHICKDPITWNPIGSKRPFYIKAKKHVKKWNDLSKEAQEISKKIYQFIERNNS